MPPRRPQRRLPLSTRIKDGRIYKKSTTTATGIIYLRCRQSTVCQGTAKIVNGEIRTINPHSQYCLPDNFAECKARFREALKEALAHHWYKLRDLNDMLAAVYHEAAARISYRSIKPYMEKCRKSLYPPTPQNIEEFVVRLRDPAFERNLEYDTGRLSATLIIDDGGNKHALFYDANFVSAEMRDVTRLFIDGTFRSTPGIQDAYQLVTIMGIKFNHGIPFMWIVMSRKTQIAYSAVFEHIRTNVIPNNNIVLVMSDFELALRNAIVQIFPRVHSTGCNTYHDRALYQKAKSLELQNLLTQDADAKSFVKKIMALAYLPARAIEAQYSRLKGELAPNLRRRLNRFLNYYKSYWLDTVKPHGFSVYGLSRRTNNILESYNSRLGHKLETRPSPWDFICKLLKLQSNAKADVHRLRNNVQIGQHARYASIYKQNELVKAWRDLHMLRITEAEFVEKAASLKGDVAELIRRETNGREGADFDLQEPAPTVPLEDDPDYDRTVFVEDPPHWLIDNAVVAQRIPANEQGANPIDQPHQVNIDALVEPDYNDVPDDRGDDTLESFDDDSIEEVFPNAIEQASDFEGDNEVLAINALPQEPEQDAIDRVEAIANIVQMDADPPEDQFDEAIVLPENLDRHTPPADVIDVLVPEQPIPPVVVQPTSTTVQHVQRVGRRRRKKRRSNGSIPAVALGDEITNPDSNKNKARNKRRKAMRDKANARSAAQAEGLQQQAALAEAARMQAELTRAQKEAVSQALLAESAQAEARRYKTLAEAHDNNIIFHTFQIIQASSISKY